jgi:hypothetical protein
MAKRGRSSKSDKAVYNRETIENQLNSKPCIIPVYEPNKMAAYKNAELALKQYVDEVSKYKKSIEYEQKIGRPVFVMSISAMECALAAAAFEKSVDAYVEIGAQLIYTRGTIRKDFYKQGYIDKTKPALDDLMNEAETLKKGKLTTQRKNKIIGKLKNLRDAVGKTGEEYAKNTEESTKIYINELKGYIRSLRNFMNEGVKLERELAALDYRASKLGVKYTSGFCRIMLNSQKVPAKVMHQQIVFEKGLQELEDTLEKC